MLNKISQTFFKFSQNTKLRSLLDFSTANINNHLRSPINNNRHKINTRNFATSIPNLHDHLTLMYVTNRHLLQQEGNLTFEQSISKLCKIAHIAALNGVTSIQYRDENTLPFEMRLQVSIALHDILKEFKIPLLINNDPYLLKALYKHHYQQNSDCLPILGLHLGQRDMPAFQARSIIGPHPIIGLTVEKMENVAVTNSLNEINYIGVQVGPSKKTKPTTPTSNIFDLIKLKELTTTSIKPVVAIGGITLENTSPLIKSGVQGVAIVSAIQDHPESAKDFRKIILEQKMLLAKTNQRGVL